MRVPGENCLRAVSDEPFKGAHIGGVRNPDTHPRGGAGIKRFRGEPGVLIVTQVRVVNPRKF